MNSYHLKYFLDAAIAGSISESAKKNNITHSAISQAIKNLEIELDITLLKHNQRKFELTESGKASIEHLEQLLLQMNGLKSKIHNAEVEPSGELIVWAPQSLIVDSLIDSFVDYQKKYPRIHLTIQTGATFQVKQSVTENRCQLGITVNDHQMKNFGTLPIAKGDFLLVSKQKKIKLTNQPILITSDEKIEVQHLINENSRLKLSELNLKTRIVSWGVIKEFVLRDFGIGYLPEYVVKNELKEKSLFQIAWPGKPFKYEITAIWNNKKPIDRNAQLLLDILKNKQP